MIGPTALIGPSVPVAGDGVSAGSGKRRVGIGVVAGLGARIAEVVGARAVAVEVVGEETGDSGGGLEHLAVVVRGVDEVDCVAVGGGRVGTGGRESGDVVEETLVTIGSRGGGCACCAAVSVVEKGAGVGDLFGVEVGEDGFATCCDEG